MVEQICKELTVHAQLEEEIFYPAAREAIDDDGLMNEAMVEHASAKDLIGQIQSMKASDPMYEATVSVLREYVNHHVEEEENEMFPEAKKSKMDLEEIGSEIAERKEVLMEAWRKQMLKAPANRTALPNSGASKEPIVRKSRK